MKRRGLIGNHSEGLSVFQAEGGRTSVEIETQWQAQIETKFDNLEVADEGALLKDEMSGPDSKISDFYLKLFTRCVRLLMCSFSPFFFHKVD